MSNILILGGGAPGTSRFGNQFVQKARSEGHRVINLSHKDYSTGNIDDIYIDYYDLDQAKSVIEKVKESMPIVDVLYFNQNGEGYPHDEEDIFSEPWPLKYHNLIQTTLVIPHLLISKLYPNNLVEGSRVLFASSHMAFQYERTYYPSAVGYPGGKSFVTHFMASAARCRTKKVTFSAICPAFLYDDPKLYADAFRITYDYILNHDDSANGKIFIQVDGLEQPFVESYIRYEK